MTAIAFTCIGAACSPSPIESLPLDITMQASRTKAAPGDTISFVATIQGSTLLGIQIDYGDGDTGLFAASGANTGKTTFTHAYKRAGTFTAKATVSDGTANQKSTSIEVRIE
jgi:hypothetical protein